MKNKKEMRGGKRPLSGRKKADRILNAVAAAAAVLLLFHNIFNN